MMPLNELSASAEIAGFTDPVKSPSSKDLLRAWERGGVYLNNASQGLEVKVWYLEAKANADSGLVEVTLSAPGGVSPGVESVQLFAFADITSVDLSFDQNMNPVVAYMQGASAKFYWFDPIASAMVHTTLPAGCSSLRCTMDEKRNFNIENSDVILAYIRSGNLAYRYQRERFLTEHVLISSLGPKAELVSIARNRALRLQFHLRFAEVTDPRAKVSVYPFLADVVKSMCVRGGVKEENIDVSELYDSTVVGYKINTKDGTNSRIDSLRKIFFFDKSEHDKTLFFPRRGREVSARIPYVHLVADDPSALGVTLVQESELPAEVNVTHLDPDGGFANNKQTVRRKSNLVKTTKKIDIESEVVLTADQAATTALITSVSAWGEPQKYKFKTGLRYAALVATDTAEVEDKNGNWHIIRITERNEDGSVISFEGNADAQELYTSLGIGRPLSPPVSTTPGLIGPTRLEILNIPCLRDQDDELGVYIAVCGESSGWFGASILISTDGLNFAEAIAIETPATIGNLQTELAVEDPLYPANQSFEVITNYALESISDESLFQNINRCVVGDEVLQFKTAVFLGMDGTKYRYRCTDLIRGRYATTIEAWPLDTRFVLLDTSVAFIQAQQWMLGREISFKPVSMGQTEDETIQTDYDYDVGMSQLEFPVYNVTAVRIGSDVTVNFTGRGRLGIDTEPRNGKYFAGYRIKYSNGQTFDTFNQTHTHAAPAGVSVQVCALNSITGEGPYSSPIPT